MRLTTLILLAGCLTARAATWPAASVHQNDVQTAIGMASNGDTVTVPAGSTNWSVQIDIPKQIIFQGAGTNSTIITLSFNGNGDPDNANIVFHPPSGYTQITGFRFNGTSINSPVGARGSPFPAIGVKANNQVLRVYNCMFSGCQLGIRPVGPFGVIDHNIFLNCRGGIQVNGNGTGQPNWINYLPGGNPGWTTTNFLFIEDNISQIDTSYYSLADTGGTLVSGGQGALFVARYNTIKDIGATIAPVYDWHGDAGDGTWGVVAVQIYKNTHLVSAGGELNQFAGLRGGWALVYSNTVTTTTGGFIANGLAYGEDHPEGVFGFPTTYNQVTNSWQWQNLVNGSVNAVMNYGYFSGYGVASWPIPGDGTGFCDVHNAQFVGSYNQVYPHPLVGGSPPPVPGSIRLIFPDVQIGEDQGPATITFVREGGSDGAVGGSFTTVNGTAIAGVNYTTTAGTVSWANGDSANKTVDVPLFNTGMTTNRVFSVVLSNPTGGASLGNPATMNVTMVGTASGETFTMASSTSSTSGSGTLNVGVLRGNGTVGTVTVDYFTQDGTALAGTDYTATSGTLSFPPGVTSSNIPVTIAYQSAPTNRVFNVILTNPQAGTALVQPTTNTVTIVGTGHVFNPGSIRLEFAAYNVNESAGTIAIRAQRVGGIDGAASVSFATADGTATAGINYGATNGTLSWPDGDSTDKIVNISIANTGFSGTRFFFFNLTGASGANLVTPSTASVTIAGSGTQTLSWSSATSSAATSGVLTNWVVRNNGLIGAVSINYATVAGTATAGVDYVATNGTVFLADSQPSNTVRTTIIYQSAPTNRLFTIKLSGASSATLAAPGTNTVTITGTPPPIFPLSVQSTNTPGGIAIVNSPADTNGITGGTTPYTLFYTNLTFVTLTAPSSVSPTNRFSQWLVNGAVFSTNSTINIPITQPTTATAVYAFTPGPPLTFDVTVNSSPISSVRVANSPPDIHGTIAGFTPFTLTFTNGTTVNFFANTVPGYTFQHWHVDGGIANTNTTLTLPILSSHSLVADYQRVQTNRGAVTLNNVTINRATILRTP